MLVSENESWSENIALELLPMSHHQVTPVNDKIRKLCIEPELNLYRPMHKQQM